MNRCYQLYAVIQNYTLSLLVKKYVPPTQTSSNKWNVWLRMSYTCDVVVVVFLFLFFFFLFFFFKACKFRIMQRTMSDGNLWSLRNLHTCKGFVRDWKIVRLRHSSLTSKIHTKNMEILKGHRALCKGKNVFKLSTPVNWCGIVYIPMN